MTCPFDSAAPKVNQFGDSRTIEITEANPRLKCCFCQKSEINPTEWGVLFKLDDIVAHYFCLMFSALLQQHGGDDEGIFGFMPTSILSELRRGGGLKCKFCKKSRATIGCAVKQCRMSYHYPCGYQKGSQFQFYGQYKSFCSKHKANQVIPEGTCRECPICMVELDESNLNDAILPPCCGKQVFHRRCMLGAAKAAGYFFKCPLCNSKESVFIEAMKENGIFVPEQDAEWERVPNAFQELLIQYSRCDAETCQCPGGREFKSDGEFGDDDGKWQVIRCIYCASSAIHYECMEVKTENWKCTPCKGLFGNADAVLDEGETLANHALATAESDDTDSESEENKAIDHNLPVPIQPPIALPRPFIDEDEINVLTTPLLPPASSTVPGSILKDQQEPTICIRENEKTESNFTQTLAPEKVLPNTMFISLPILTIKALTLPEVRILLKSTPPEVEPNLQPVPVAEPIRQLNHVKPTSSPLSLSEATVPISTASPHQQVEPLTLPKMSDNPPAIPPVPTLHRKSSSPKGHQPLQKPTSNTPLTRSPRLTSATRHESQVALVSPVPRHRSVPNLPISKESPPRPPHLPLSYSSPRKSLVKVDEEVDKPEGKEQKTKSITVNNLNVLGNRNGNGHVPVRRSTAHPSIGFGGGIEKLPKVKRSKSVARPLFVNYEGNKTKISTKSRAQLVEEKQTKLIDLFILDESDDEVAEIEQDVVIDKVIPGQREESERSLAFRTLVQNNGGEGTRLRSQSCATALLAAKPRGRGLSVPKFSSSGTKNKSDLGDEVICVEDDMEETCRRPTGNSATALVGTLKRLSGTTTTDDTRKKQRLA